VPQTIVASQYIIGAADVYYRAIGSVAAWTSIGATINPIIFRIHQATFNPSDQFNGLLELVREMDYTSKQSAEAEFEMPQIAGPNLALAIRGVQSSVLANTDAGGTPFSSTLAAAAAIGDTNVKVAAITNLVAGDWIRIDVTAGGLAEYRQIDVVGTIGAGGTGVSFRNPLIRAHASGVAAVESVGDGKTELVPGNTRRMPLTAYNDFALVAQSASDYYELMLYNAITTADPIELSFGDQTMAAIKTTIGTRKDGLNLALPSWKLRVP
jgi:hypothetical protein